MGTWENREQEGHRGWEKRLGGKRDSGTGKIEKNIATLYNILQ